MTTPESRGAGERLASLAQTEGLFNAAGAWLQAHGRLVSYPDSGTMYDGLPVRENPWHWETEVAVDELRNRFPLIAERLQLAGTKMDLLYSPARADFSGTVAIVYPPEVTFGTRRITVPGLNFEHDDWLGIIHHGFRPALAAEPGPDPFELRRHRDGDVADILQPLPFTESECQDLQAVVDNLPTLVR